MSEPIPEGFRPALAYANELHEDLGQWHPGYRGVSTGGGQLCFFNSLLGSYL